MRIPIFGIFDFYDDFIIVRDKILSKFDKLGGNRAPRQQGLDYFKQIWDGLKPWSWGMIVQIFNEDKNTWFLCFPVRKYGFFEQKEDFENTWFVCLLDIKYGAFEQK